MSGEALLFELRVPCDEAELAADAMWSASASAVEQRDNGDGTLTLVADVAPSGSWQVQQVPVKDDWFDRWRAWARAWRAAPSSRLVVKPPWVATIEDVRPDDVVISVDPGRAFGSGSHPSTRQALALLERFVWSGSSVLDVGCGSGVLALAAVRLGATRTVALDVDQEAIRATNANAPANNVGHRVMATMGTASEISDQFNVVVANISATTIVELAPALMQRVADRGLLVVAGFVVQNRDRILAAFPGWRPEQSSEEDGWVALVLSRNPIVY